MQIYSSWRSEQFLDFFFFSFFLIIWTLRIVSFSNTTIVDFIQRERYRTTKLSTLTFSKQETNKLSSYGEPCKAEEVTICFCLSVLHCCMFKLFFRVSVWHSVLHVWTRHSLMLLPTGLQAYTFGTFSVLWLNIVSMT